MTENRDVFIKKTQLQNIVSVHEQTQQAERAWDSATLTWQVFVVLLRFPLRRADFDVRGVVAPSHGATVFHNPIQAVKDTLAGCQVLTEGNEISILKKNPSNNHQKEESNFLYKHFFSNSKIKAVKKVIYNLTQSLISIFVNWDHLG